MGYWRAQRWAHHRCRRLSGSVFLFRGPMGFHSFFPVLTDPSQNVVGRIIKNADGGNWNLPGSYRVKCECQTRTASYVTAKMLLSEPVFSSGD